MDDRPSRPAGPSGRRYGQPPRWSPPRRWQPPVPPTPASRDGYLRSRDVREMRRGMAASADADGPTRRIRAGRDRQDRRRIDTAKTVLAVASVLVLLFTGYAWSTFQQLTSNLSTTPVIAGLAAADGATDVLLVGSDSRVDAQGNPLAPEVLAQLRAGNNEGDLTDTLILVRIPNDGSRAVGISIPRDSFVEIAGGHGKHKINSAYGRAKNAAAARLREEGDTDDADIERQSVLEGRKALVTTIEDLTGAGIDHYAEVNLLGFYEITNAIGGVEVCLNRATRDRESGADFPAGRQTIAGADALAFVRQRKNLPRGDLDRIVRQQVFMSGVADKVLSAGTLANPGTLRALIESLQRSIVLDDKLDPLAFAEQMRGIASGAVQFVTIPVLDINAETSDGSSVTVDPAAVRRFVSEQTTEQPAGTDEPADVDPASITVDVRNASGVSGIAGRVLQELTGLGFTPGDAGNATGRAVSVVRHADGEDALGSAVADALGGLATEPDPELAAGRVQVFLGEDYGGPGAQRLATEPLVRLDGGYRAQQPSDPAPVTAGDIRCVD